MLLSVTASPASRLDRRAHGLDAYHRKLRTPVTAVTADTFLALAIALAIPLPAPSHPRAAQHHVTKLLGYCLHQKRQTGRPLFKQSRA